jgi:SNF2 family DNA or RNA helicase
VYQSKTNPYDHQKKIGPKLHDESAFALLMDMGTGKSKVIVDEFGEAIDRDEIDDLLLIAPAGSYLNWPDELKEHMDPRVYKWLVIGVWQSGKSKKPIEALLKANPDRPRVLIVNIEAFGSVALAKQVCLQFLANRRVMIVIDESTAIKNGRAKRTKFVLTLRDLSVRRRILTGLPTPNSPLDIYSQFEFLDPRILGYPNFISFRARHATMKTIKTGRVVKKWNKVKRCMEYVAEEVDIVTGYRFLDHIQKRIAPYSYRVLKKDCLDLPPQVYEPYYIDLTAEQKRLYKEIRENATAQLAGGTYVNATRVITQMIRLHQILCGFVTDELGNIKPVPSYRLNRMMELIGDAGDQKIIIWCSFDYSIRQIAAALVKEYGKEAVAMFWGGNKSTRHLDEARFKEDSRCRFICSTPGAGGKGNTWTQASLTIYYSNSFNLEHRLQSEDRPHRIGQTANSCTYIDLWARKTIEDKQISALRQKINLATAITGDNYRQWLI